MKLNEIELAMGAQARQALLRAEDRRYHEMVIAEQWCNDNIMHLDPDAGMDMAVSGTPIPAACRHGCTTLEPDGYCEHGHPSVLKVLGLF